MNLKEEIIEFLICNQSHLKKETEGLKRARDILLEREQPIFREDLLAQYDARIRQFVAFYTADRMAIPAEWVIIQLEHIELEDFLNV
jgi:hypothetical protein